MAAAAFAEPMSHEVIGGLIAGGLTALESELGGSEAPDVAPVINDGGGPTLGGECVSGVSGGVCGVVALGGCTSPELAPPFVGAPFGPEPTPLGPDLSIFLYLLLRF